jgi:STAS-like domain of unknown function (DUF4325)
MNNLTFNIADDFSKSPGPRYSWQGPMSGEVLRRQLVKLLRDPISRITIILDGTRGFGSSFLDEAFGGLIRSDGFSFDEVRNRMNFVSDFDPTYIQEINESLERAVKENVH